MGDQEIHGGIAVSVRLPGKLHQLLRIFCQQQFEVAVLMLPAEHLMLLHLFQDPELIVRTAGQAVDLKRSHQIAEGVVRSGSDSDLLQLLSQLHQLQATSLELLERETGNDCGPCYQRLRHELDLQVKDSRFLRDWQQIVIRFRARHARVPGFQRLCERNALFRREVLVDRRAHFAHACYQSIAGVAGTRAQKVFPQLGVGDSLNTVLCNLLRQGRKLLLLRPWRPAASGRLLPAAADGS